MSEGRSDGQATVETSMQQAQVVAASLQTGTCPQCRKPTLTFGALDGRLRMEMHGRDDGGWWRPCKGKRMTPVGVHDPYRVMPA